MKIIAKAGVVAASLGEFPWSEYAATAQFQASFARVVLAVAIAACAYLPLRTRSGWVVLSALTGALLLSGAWLVHGAGRLEGRAPLMMLTVLHQLAAGVWVGSVIQLAALWRRSRATDLQSFWPIAVTRFSSLGMTAVALLLASGLALAWHYVGSWRGLLGTGYGQPRARQELASRRHTRLCRPEFFRRAALAEQSSRQRRHAARAVSDRSRNVPPRGPSVPRG